MSNHKISSHQLICSVFNPQVWQLRRMPIFWGSVSSIEFKLSSMEPHKKLIDCHNF